MNESNSWDKRPFADKPDTATPEVQQAAPTRQELIAEIEKGIATCDQIIKDNQERMRNLRADRDDLNRHGIEGNPVTQAAALKAITEAGRDNRVRRAEVASRIADITGGAAVGVGTPAEQALWRQRKPGQ